VAGLIAAARGEPLPGPADVAWAVTAGTTGGLGLASLYRGLATGRMGVIAPVTGVLAAAIPVLAGIALAGPPSPLRAVGLGLGLVAIVLVSLSADRGPTWAGLGLAIAAGVGFGLFNTAISRVTPGLVFGPLVAARGTAACLVAIIVAVSRRPWRPSRRLVPALLVVGALDMAGNALFLSAAQAGRLDVAALLSSLYPVTTILLAVAFLRERVTGAHGLGVAAAGAAIACIALG
jgi:drug/metabolite transporter (DMT)-like permease